MNLNLKIIKKQVKDLIPYINNARTHDEGQVEQIAASIKEFGFNNPILLDGSNGVIAGHGRLMAAKKLGLKEVPCIELSHLSEAQKKAYILADNKIALNAGWDEELLKIELSDLDDNFKNLIGFSDDELNNLLDSIDETGESGYSEISAEAAEEVPEKVETKAKLGDIWQLGEHRLMCGSSSDEECIKKLMNGEIADMVFTSPPYNGNNTASDGDIFGKGNKSMKLYNNGYSDNLSSDDYIAFTEKVLELCFKYTKGFIFWNVNYNSNSKYEYIKQIYKFLPNLIEQVCWKKSSAIPLKGCMRRNWEPIYIFSNTNKNLELDEVETNMWEISNTNSQASDHKACFPVALPAKGISLVKPKTNIVLEPFCGSGSTMIACEQMNRKCYSMDIDPHYIDVAIQRWENLTGRKAVLIEKGEKDNAKH